MKPTRSYLAVILAGLAMLFAAFMIIALASVPAFGQDNRYQAAAAHSLVRAAAPAGSSQSNDPDPGYARTFGYGVVVASGKGYPAFGKFEAAQFKFEQGKFIIAAGPSATLDVRAILPRGMTIAQAVDKVQRERAENLKYKVEEFMIFQIWFSQDQSGKVLVDAEHPWPQKPTDVPTWGQPREQRYTVTDESKAWTGAAATWEEMKGELWELASARPGQKLYVIYRVGYKYKTPAGELESKWDPNLRQFIQVPSKGLLGFVLGEPLAVGTIEIGDGNGI